MQKVFLEPNPFTVWVMKLLTITFYIKNIQNSRRDEKYSVLSFSIELEVSIQGI